MSNTLAPKGVSAWSGTKSTNDVAALKTTWKSSISRSKGGKQGCEARLGKGGIGKSGGNKGGRGKDGTGKAGGHGNDMKGSRGSDGESKDEMERSHDKAGNKGGIGKASKQDAKPMCQGTTTHPPHTEPADERITHHRLGADTTVHECRQNRQH